MKEKLILICSLVLFVSLFKITREVITCSSNEYDENVKSIEQYKYSQTTTFEPLKNEKKINTKRALTKEEAEALKGTGYKGTRPNSSAEDMEISAAMVKCKNCGMHSSNGYNSLCDECEYNKSYGFD